MTAISFVYRIKATKMEGSHGKTSFYIPLGVRMTRAQAMERINMMVGHFDYLELEKAELNWKTDMSMLGKSAFED